MEKAEAKPDTVIMEFDVVVFDYTSLPKPRYFTLLIMFFVEKKKVLNMKMLQMAFYEELKTVSINRSNYWPLL